MAAERQIHARGRGICKVVRQRVRRVGDPDVESVRCRVVWIRHRMPRLDVIDAVKQYLSGGDTGIDWKVEPGASVFLFPYAGREPLFASPVPIARHREFRRVGKLGEGFAEPIERVAEMARVGDQVAAEDYPIGRYRLEGGGKIFQFRVTGVFPV